MKLTKKLLFIFFLLLTLKVAAQTPAAPPAVPPNIGFENGTFDNWVCYIGNIDALGVVNVSQTAPVPGRQTIYGRNSAKVLDPYGGFPVLCPNGSNYSIQLGNNDVNAQAERVTYTFTVPQGSSYSLIFNYAVVLDNPAHAPFQQPKFTAQVYDVTDNLYIDCPSFNFVASSGLPGFKLSNTPGSKGASVYYKDWSTATIDLRAYIGKTIRLEFTTNDCTLGAHFGYAYLDIGENSEAPITGNAYCNGAKSVTLYGPNGFAGYNWYDASLKKFLGSGQSIKISPAPPNNTQYAVVISPYLGVGCVDTLYTTVNKIDEGFNLIVPDTIYGCPGTGVDLTAASVTKGTSAGTALTYYTDSLATNYLYNPDRVTEPGLYYIQGVNKEGCMNILPIQVVLANPTINVTDPPTVSYPVPVDLSTTFPHQKGITYQYYSDPGATASVSNYNDIRYSGKFYIKATNNAGCDTIAPVNVTIIPPPPYVINAPNAFTPNNDGINDHFNLSIKGYVGFDMLRVYNRYGQLVFTGKSAEEYWDGIYKGQNLPEGAYYWVFDGEDTYNNVKITRAGNINLLR